MSARRHISGGLLVALAVLHAACDHGALEAPNDLDPTFGTVQQRVFSQSCALSGCHVGTAAPMGLDLSAGNAYAHIVGVPSVQVPNRQRVAPGDPAASYLVMKVEGAPGIVGGRMPLGRDPLSPADVALLREWIGAGALDN